MQQETTNAPKNCRMKCKCILTTIAIVLLGASTAYLFMQHNNQKAIIKNQENDINELKDILSKQNIGVTGSNLKSYPNILFDNSWLSFREQLANAEEKISKLWDNDLTLQGAKGTSSYYSYIATSTLENEYVITVALPGLAKESIVIELIGDKLVISAAKAHLDKSDNETDAKAKDQLNDENQTAQLLEQNHAFKQVIKIPNDIDQDNIKIKLNNGLLTITLPRVHDKTNQEPRKILID